MALQADGFDRSVPLPPELKITHIREAIVAIWRVDIVFLREENWKYEGSKAAEGRGGRTHTFGIKLPAKLLRNCIVYQNPRAAIRQGGPVLASLDE
jgi:hypothetical protein